MCWGSTRREGPQGQGGSRGGGAIAPALIRKGFAFSSHRAWLEATLIGLAIPRREMTLLSFELLLAGRIAQSYATLGSWPRLIEGTVFAHLRPDAAWV